MHSLSERIQQANTLLATFAVPLHGTLGRIEIEADDATRFPFQRDRDRIIHTRAFRRLKGKTQVFVYGAGDHYRTRLTHTLEVVQISRDIARTLTLNEDLAECIALAHDLGHPPFGHAGEAALDEWMQKHQLRFEHNEQSHRIMTQLETHSTLFKGLNLNQEILEGLLKHHTPHDTPQESEFTLQHAPSLEASVVNIADEIAYTGHDCDDGLRAGLFSVDELLTVSLAARAYAQTKKRGTSLRGAVIDVLVTDLYEESERCIEKHNIHSLEDVYSADTSTIHFSQKIQEELFELRTFLSKKMYFHPAVLEKSDHGRTVVTDLCESYMKNAPEKVQLLQQKHDSSLETAIKDYVSGMTDLFAVEQWNALASS